MSKNLRSAIKDQDPEVRRKAILALARSGDQRALPLLKEIYESDPNHDLRELAKRCGQQLWAQLQQRSSTPSATEPDQEAKTPVTKSTEMTEAVPPPLQAESSLPRASKRVMERARGRLSQSMAEYVAGNLKAARTEFRKAVSLSPQLVADPFTQNLAGELTGLPPQEAFQTLLGEKENQFSDLPQERIPVKEVERKRSITPYLLVLSTIVLIGLVIWFVQAGFLDRYLLALRTSGIGVYRRSVIGYDYLLVPPEGDQPTYGWPVVVALHGYDGEGAHMLPLADAFTEAGAVFVAPTFYEYPPASGQGPIGPMVRILQKVEEGYDVDPRGAVLLGFSQGGTFAYRFSVMHPEWVSGVVTAGAPDLDASPPSGLHIRYVFTWGEHDGLKDFVSPIAMDFQRQGYPVESVIVNDAGHEVTPYAVQRALGMVESLKGE